MLPRLSYRNCPGRKIPAQPRLVCRGSPDRNLTFQRTNPAGPSIDGLKTWWMSPLACYRYGIADFRVVYYLETMKCAQQMIDDIYSI